LHNLIGSKALALKKVFRKASATEISVHNSARL
jgi:hypothetical protein